MALKSVQWIQSSIPVKTDRQTHTHTHTHMTVQSGILNLAMVHRTSARQLGNLLHVICLLQEMKYKQILHEDLEYLIPKYKEKLLARPLPGISSTFQLCFENI